jgi:hypothetical protein
MPYSTDYGCGSHNSITIIGSEFQTTGRLYFEMIRNRAYRHPVEQ